MQAIVTTARLDRYVAALLLLATAGCAQPLGVSQPPSPEPSFGSVAAPVQLVEQTPPAPVESAKQTRSVAKPPTAAAPTDAGVATVAWNRPLRGRAVTAAPCGCGPAHGGDGCGGCEPSRYFTSGPWNQYGIDGNEFLCDGGDRNENARPGREEAIVGIELEDTVARFNTEDGDVYVTPSNRVCLYAPRFAAVRRVTEPVGQERVVAAQGYDLPEGPLRIGLKQPSSAVTAQHSPERNVAARTPDAMRDKNRGVPVEGVDQPIMAEDVLAVLTNLSLITRGQLTDAEKPWLAKGALAAVTWSRDENVAVTVNDLAPMKQIRIQAAEELTLYEYPEGRLRIGKLADKQAAQPGEQVTFFLRVDNVGDAPVENIVITDNLTTRLEYVEDSQEASVDAEFSVAPNDGQSLRLTWKLAEPLGVGKGATIQFKCRVR